MPAKILKMPHRARCVRMRHRDGSSSEWRVLGRADSNKMSSSRSECSYCQRQREQEYDLPSIHDSSHMNSSDSSKSSSTPSHPCYVDSDDNVQERGANDYCRCRSMSCESEDESNDESSNDSSESSPNDKDVGGGVQGRGGGASCAVENHSSSCNSEDAVGDSDDVDSDSDDVDGGSDGATTRMDEDILKYEDLSKSWWGDV